MKIRWSERAATHLESIYEYIAQDKPNAARSVIAKLIETAEILVQNPKIGRAGAVKGTRELVVPPFIIVYSLDQDVIDIRAVLHGSRKW